MGISDSQRMGLLPGGYAQRRRPLCWGASCVSSREPWLLGSPECTILPVRRALHPCYLCWEQPHHFFPISSHSFSISHHKCHFLREAFLDSFICSLNTMNLSSKALEGYPSMCVFFSFLLVFLRQRLPVFRFLPPPPRTPFSAEHRGSEDSFHSRAAGQWDVCRSAGYRTEFPVEGRACLLPHSLLRGMLSGVCVKVRRGVFKR